VAANAGGIGAGTAANPRRYPGFSDVPSIAACSAMTSITT